MFFLLSIGVSLGIYIGYTFREDIQSIFDVHEVFEQEKSLRNTVLPDYVSQLLPDGWLSWLETAKFVGDVAVLYVDQWLRRTCQPYRDGLYQIRFMIDEKLYALLVRPTRGPDEYAVFDEDTNQDVSDVWHPFLRGQRAVVTPLIPKLVGNARVIRLVSVCEPDLSRIVMSEEPLIVGPS